MTAHAAQTGIDEAFDAFGSLVAAHLELAGEVVGPGREAGEGARVRLESMRVETPVELDVVVESDGTVRIGCVPPLYRLATTIEPVLHRWSFTAVRARTLTGGPE